MKYILKAAAAFCAALALCAAAEAHITLATKTAPVGSYYKAVFRVPHGCNGSDTTALRIRIPEGVVDVKPQPKAGWTLELKQGAYAQPVKLHGATLDRGVREVGWSGDLPDAYYDEFTLMTYLSSSLKAGQKLYFPVVQECKQGVVRWIDTSGGGEGAHPAPSVTLTPAAKASH